MIEIKNKQIIIDGKPRIIISGEIHYFRLKREDWEDRIAKLKKAGCNAVASYVPWICHEEIEGKIDLEGKTRPELDLGGFIDLCKDNGLYFILRPGPFIMAEMKNEGIPYWVYKKHPEIVPKTWDNKTTHKKTVDYLAPSFLDEVKKWYKEVMSIIVPRLYGNGGNIIGIQLDNEIGMLQWVSNTPDLSDSVLSDFALYLKKRYSEEELNRRYPFSLDNEDIRNSKFRSPEEEYSLQLLHDLGYFMRKRFADYVSTLRSFAEEFGVKDIPFIVNIHGTGGGRGFTFPIGISQLYESYTQDKGYISGSDIYLGDLKLNNFQDLYLINNFMEAVHNEDQPLTSMEFECGDGNYGDNFSTRYDPSAVDFKMRMCIAQGNRLINNYLFAGGYNYRLDEKVNDGNDRIAFTGERHGFAAPVNPEGKLNYTFPRMSRVIKTILAVEEKIATMQEESDNIYFAFIPDYYMTEYFYPGSNKMKEFKASIEINRGYSAWETLAKGLLLSNFRFKSIDIQNRNINLNQNDVLIIPTSRYLSSEIQTKLLEFIEKGGNALIYGELPQFDMEGNKCSILSDALKVEHKNYYNSSEDFFLSIYPEDYLNFLPEIMTDFAEAIKVEEGKSILKIYGTDETCGTELTYGKGKVVLITAHYNCNLNFIRTILKRLGKSPKLTHNFEDHGIFMTSTVNNKGERFIHILNLDGFEKNIKILEDDNVLFDGLEISLQPHDALMLPLNVTFEDLTILYSTAEIMSISKDKMQFRLTQNKDIIALQTQKQILPSNDYIIKQENNKTLIISQKNSKIDSLLTVYIK